MSVGTKSNVTLITLTINIISVTVTDGWLLNHDLTAIDDVQALCWFVSETSKKNTENVAIALK